MMRARRGLPWIDFIKKVSVYLFLVSDEFFRDEFGRESEFRVVQKI